MPTGYTADVIEKNITFREFALRCMRAFGALVSLRDEDMRKVVTEVPLRDYHKKSLAKAKILLCAFNSLTPAIQADNAVLAIKESYERSKESRKRAIEENKRLNRMIAQVKKWKPPTPEHIRYKEFMLEQLTISLSDLKYYAVKKPNTSKKAIAAWIESRRSELERNVAYHAEYWAKDLKNNAEANAWIKAIIKSLPK